MLLFNKEKDIVHRFFNLVIVVWFIIAIVVLYSNCVDLIIKKPLPSYKRFEAINCLNISDKESCERRYESEKLMIKRNEFNNKKTIIMSLGNVIIVSTALYLLNRKKK